MKTLTLALALFGATVSPSFATETTPALFDGHELCARLFEVAETHGARIGPENIANSLWVPLAQLQARIDADRSNPSREDRVHTIGRAWLASYLDDYDSFYMSPEGEMCPNARELLHRLERLASARRRATAVEAPLRTLIEGREAILAALAPLVDDAVGTLAAPSADHFGPVAFTAAIESVVRFTPPESGLKDGPLYREYRIELPLPAPSLTKGDPLGAAELRAALKANRAILPPVRALRVHMLLFSDGYQWKLHLYAFEQRFSNFWIARTQVERLPRALADFILAR